MATTSSEESLISFQDGGDHVYQGDSSSPDLVRLDLTENLNDIIVSFI